MSQIDDCDADVSDPLDKPDVEAVCDEMIEGVFDHLGRTLKDESGGWDTEDGS